MDKDTIDFIGDKLKESYLSKIKKLIAAGNIMKAKKPLLLFLKMHPDNQEAQKIKSELFAKLKKYESELLLKLKTIAIDFIKEYYPGEKLLFNVIWDVLEDYEGTVLTYKKSFSNALALVDDDQRNLRDIVTPIVIISIKNGYLKHGPDMDSFENLLGSVIKIAEINGAKPDLIKKLIEYLKDRKRKIYDNL